MRTKILNLRKTNKRIDEIQTKEIRHIKQKRRKIDISPTFNQAEKDKNKKKAVVYLLNNSLIYYTATIKPISQYEQTT